jgi:hypothetical protein
MHDPALVGCDEPGCTREAVFKIAAPWTDGRFWELKTYGFACRHHLRGVLRSAEARWLDYEPVRGESVELIGIYRYLPGQKDRALPRFESLEDAEAEVD